MNFNRIFLYILLFFVFQHARVIAQTNPVTTIPGARTWGELVGDLNCTLPIEYDITAFTIRKAASTAEFDVVTFSTPVVGDFLTTNDKTEVLILSKPTNQDRTGIQEKNWTAVAAPLNKLYITRDILVYTYDNDGAGGLVLKKTIKTPDLNYEGPSPFLIAKVPGYDRPLVIVATSSASEKYPSRLIAYDETSNGVDDFKWISSEIYGANVPGIDLIHEQKDANGVTVLVPYNDLKFRSGSSPGIANFDLSNPNQYPGVYVYNEIFSLDPAKNGNNKIFNGGPLGQGISTITAGGIDDGLRNSSFGGSMAVSVAADVIPGNGMLELVCGNTVYKINPDFSLNRAIPLNINGVPAPDGFTSIANIDQSNGRLDIVVTTGRSAITQSRLVYVWTVGGGDNAQLIATREIGDAPGWSADFHKTARNTGLAFIGDIDGNGQSEIGVASPYKLSMLSYNQGTGTLDEKWAIPTDDESGHTLITMFDFDQDGTQELVYRQERALKILGENGQDIKSIELWGSTAGDGALVADLNGDGEADIIVTDTKDNITYFSNNQYPEKPDAKLVVFKSVLGTPWAPARSVWNQYAYFSFNVNDDLTIPIPQENHGLTIGSFFPSYDPLTGCLTAATRPFNSFLVQRTLYTEGGCFSSGIPIMDAKVELIGAKFLCLDAGNNQIEVELTISNPGDAVLPAEVRIQFSLGTTLIDNVAVGEIVDPKGSVTKTIVINSSLGDNPVLPLSAVINPAVNGVYDFPECTYDGPVTIPVIPRPVFVVDPPNAICEGDPTGIFIEVTNTTAGSVEDAVVKWYKDAANGTLIIDGLNDNGTVYTIDADFSLQIDNLPAAATPYKFYLVDECSNVPAKEVLVRVDPSPVIDFVEEDVKCYGGNTGFIKEIIGDQAYITYRLEGETNFITGPELKARFFSEGVYNVTAKASLNDPAACLADFQFTIGEPDLFEFLNPGQTEPLCAPTTGAISWNIQGGNPTAIFPFYTYTLTKNGSPVTGFVIEEVDGKNVINGLDGGEYILTATDSKGCTIPQNFTLITQEDPGFFIEDAAAICFGNDAVFEVDMTAPGVGIAIPSYEWGKVTGGVFTPITTGQTIDGGVATIDNNGRRLSISGLPASATEYAYQVRITGENTCDQVPLDTKIKVNPLPDPEFNVVNVSCFGESSGSISLSNTLTGTFSFSLVGPSNETNTNGIFKDLSAGPYTITVTNTVTNCEITLEPIVVTQPAALALSNQILGQPSCGEDNGSYSIDFQGGTAPYTLVLSQGTTVLETIPNFTGSNYSKSGLAPGDYVFTLTDENNCIIEDSFILINDPKLPIGLVLADVEICEGEVATFLPVIDTGGNPRTVNWFYDALGEDPIAAGDDPSVAGVSYALDGEKLVVTGLKNGGNRTYFVEVSGELYCTILEPVSVTIFAVPAPEFDKLDILCFGEKTGKIFLTAGGDPKLEYNIDGGTAVSQAALEALTFVAGTYEIAFRHVDTNCGGTASVTIDQPDALVLANQTLGQPSCGEDNGSYSIDFLGGTAPYNLVLSQGATVLETIPNFTGSNYSKSELAPGDYIFTLTDVNNCLITDQFTLTNDPKLPIGLVLEDVEICEGEIGTFQPVIDTGGNPRTVKWFYDALGLNQIVAGADPSVTGVSYEFVGENLVVTGIKNGADRIYYLGVSGDAYCPVIEPAIIKASPPLLVSINVPEAICFGEAVTVTVDASGGQGIIEYSLDGGLYQSSNIFQNVAVGTHTLAVRSVNGCTYQETIEVLGPTAPITLEDDFVIIGASCGQANGIIQNVNVVGGWGNFTFEWRKGSSTGTPVPGTINSAQNLSAGTYYLVVTDEKGCEEIFEFIVPEQPFPDLVLVPLVICEGDDAEFKPTQTVSGASQTVLIWYKDAAGTVLIETGPDGTMPLVNYTVDGESLLIAGLPAGIYTYYLKIECSGEMKPVTVTVNAAPKPVLAKVDILCFGTPTGKIKVTADGNPDFRYSIDNGAVLTQAELEAMNFIVGTYNVVVTQLGTDCTSTQEVEISQPEEFVFTALDKADPTCGSNNGTIQFSISGGVPAYVITINNDPLSNFTYTEAGGVYTVTGLALGTYEIEITDANSCVLSPPNISLVDDNINSVLSTNLEEIICQGDAAVLTPELTITGGATTIIKWFKDAALTDPIVDNYVATGTGIMFGIDAATGVLTAYNLPVGDYTYYLEVSGADICTVSSKAEVKVTAVPDVVLDKVDVLCFGDVSGKITLVSGANPNLEYSINGATPISQTALLELELAAGTYIVNFNYVGSDCIGTQTLIIEESTEIVLTVVGQTAPACGESDGTISFSVSGGVPAYAITINNEPISSFTYTEVDGVYTVTGLSLGNYEIEVKDENDCVVPPYTFTLVDDNINTVLSNNLDEVICVGQSAVLTPELTISGGASTIIKWFGDAELTEPIVDNYVAGGTGQMFGINTTTGELTVYNLPVGNYTYYLEVSGPDICTVSSKADVEVTPAPNVVLDKVDVLCFGEVTGEILLVSGGDPNLEYSINGAAPISQTALQDMKFAAGTYVVDYNYVGSTCGGTQTLVIEQPTEIELAIVGSTIPACGVEDGTISFSISGGVPAYAITINNQPLASYTSSVANGVYTVTGLSLGTYDIAVTDANGCVLNSPAAFVLADGNAVSVVSPNISVTICEGEQAVLTPDLTISGGVVPTLKWFRDAGLTDEISSNYIATGTGTMFAIDAATGVLTVYNLPVGDFVYYLEISDPLICTANSRADVKVTAAPNPVLSKVDVLCFGEVTGEILLVSGGDPNLEYSINGAAPISQTALQDMKFAAGTYVVDYNYVGSTCGGTQTLVIEQPTEIELAIVGSTVPACGVEDGTISFNISGGVPAYAITINNQPLASYTSSVANGVYTVTGLTLGTYDIAVTDANGCVLNSPAAFVLADGNAVSVVSPNISVTICEGEQAVLTPNLTISGGVVPTIKWYRDAGLTDEISSNYVATGTGTMFAIDAATGALTVYNLPIGDFVYYLEVSDPLICTANSRADVKVTAAPNPVLSKVDVLCFGEITGEILLVSGGDPNLEYRVNGAAPISQTALQAMKFAAGTYVIDYNYVGSTCGGTQTLVIEQPTEIELAIVGSTIPACGVEDGTISFSISGGVPAYAITINNQPLSTFTSTVSNGAYTVTGLTLGSYDIVVTDANGCVLNAPAAFVLSDGNPVSVVSPNISVTICEGEQAVLTPNLTISGGVVPTIKWFRDAGLNDEIIPNYVATGTGTMFAIDAATGVLTVYNLSIGDFVYYLEVSDPLICTANSRADVKVTAAPNPVLSKVDVLCFGEVTGEILLVSGGDPNLEYSINGAAPISQTALQDMKFAAGIYVVDYNYVGSTCGGTQTLVIEQPTEIELAIVGSTVPACGVEDGTISFNISGGVPAYAITINNQPLASYTSSVANGIYTVTGLSLGTYDIAVTDANDCNLNAPAAFVLSDGNPVSVVSPNISVTICEGEQAVLTPDLTISGGVVPTLKWFRDAGLTDEISSNYVATGTGTMFAIDAATGALTVYNLSIGDFAYYLEITDPLICTANSRADVKVTAAPNPVLSKVDVLCFGEITGEILLVSGGDPNLEYSINGAAPISQTALQAMKFAAGTYVIDYNYVGSTCGGTQTLVIEQPDALKFELLNKVDAFCGEENGSIEFSLIGGTKGYTITINNQSIASYNPTIVGDSYTLENLPDGIYNIKILDANNCLVEESLTLANTNLLSISAADMQTEVCEGSPAVFVPNINNQSGVNPMKRWFRDQNLTDEITSNYIAGGAGVMYQIDPTTGTLSVYNLAAGDFTFYLELTDAQICPIVVKAEVKVNPFPLSQFEVLDILCFGDQTGKIRLVSASNNDLRFTVNGGAQMTQAALEAMEFPAGIYTIETINIGAICPDVQIKEIKQPEELIFEAISFLEPTCDESNGDAVFSVAGGKAPYTILINGQALSAYDFAVDNDRYVIGNLAPGIYDISITDANGCTEGGNFELTNIVATPITADKMVAEVCEGSPIEFTPVFQSGGVDPKKRWFRDAILTQEILSNFAPTGTGVMYDIDPVSGKLTVYNLPDGNYTYYLQLSDPQICTLVTTAEGIVNPGIEAQAFPTNEVCYEGADGSILVDDLSGGSGVYEFSLDNANWQSGNLFDNLASGTYTVYIRDLGGQASCVLTLPNILIEGPTAPISINNDFILIPSSCDLANGSISNVQISGGWGNFTFEWRKGSATGTVIPGTIDGAENLLPDLYYLIVKDEKGCEEIFEFEIKEQDKPNFTALVPMAICALDDMTLTVIQNVPGASTTQFTWSKGPNQTNPVLDGPDGSINGVEYEIREVLNSIYLDISGLPAGSYTYYFYAECTGQEIPISFEVVAIPEPEFGILEISCFDADNGKIVVTSEGSADLTYSVDGGSFMSKTELEAMNFGPGTFTLLAQNSQGCISLPQTLTLDQPDPLEIILLDSKNSACGTNDGFIKLNLKGGTPEYTLILTKDGVVVETITTSAAEYTFANLEAGVYDVELRDKNDCQLDLVGNITLLDGPTEILIDDKFIICERESLTLEPSINPATANPVYTWYWNSPTAGNEISDQQQIGGILFEINATGFLTISGLQIGTDYKVWVKVSGPDICEGDLKEVLVQVVPIPVFTAISADENCFGEGGTIQITQGPGQNNITYSVNGGAFQTYPGNLITGLTPGNYTLTAQNAGGCTFDLAQTFVIAGPSAALTLANIQAADANCGATDGTLTGQINGGTPGYQVSLLDGAGNVVLGPVLSQDGSIEFNNLGSGAYSLAVADAQGCLVTAQEILIDESPKIILADDQMICEGEVAVIRPSLVPAEAGITFNWFYDRDMTIPVRESLTPDQFGATYQIAANGEISMSGLPSRPAPYTYYIMVDEAGICPPEVKEVKVTVRPIPTLRVSNPSIVCDPNQTVNLTQFIEGFNPNVFDYIVTSPNGTTMRLEDLATVSGTGSYTVQSSFKGSNCWTPVDRIAVIISDIQLIADFQYEIVIDGQVFTDYDLQTEDQINFKDISQGNVIVWNWDFGDGTSSNLQNPSHQYDAPGRYVIRLTTIDQFGCTSVIERVLEIFNDYLIRIPNAFTPDGLTNKFFKPKFRGIVTMKLYIFNTWGDLIYETDNLEDQGWDGTLNGQKTPNGNYVYKAIFTTRTNEVIERAGVFILIR